MPKRVAIVQSCYIPWKGYFDLINLVDEFVLFDDRQYTRRDWRNRNRVKTPAGPVWLTIPVRAKGRYDAPINTIEVEGSWRDRHWQTLAHSYRRAPFFDRYAAEIEPLYRGDETLLSDVNRRFIDAICTILGIVTTITWSTDYRASGERSERLVDLCRQAGATAYLSGPAARAYLDEELFRGHGIDVAYMDYVGYPEYPQLHGPFDHHVSVLDLLFHTGPDAARYMKSFSG
jgi:hypothetical protein